MARITLLDVQEELRKHDWKCLSKEYQNLNASMSFQCPFDHLVETAWGKLRKKIVCPTCNMNLKSEFVDVGFLKKGEEFRTLALDQSSNKTGWAVYDNEKLIKYGVFQTSKGSGLERIVNLCEWINSVLANWKPDLVGIEDIQYNPRGEKRSYSEQLETGDIRGHDTFKLLGQVMGAVMLTIARNKCEVATVNNKVWKGHCGIKGRTRADQKRSAQLLVEKWHGVKVMEDESDAICIGKYFTGRRGTVKEGIGEY